MEPVSNNSELDNYIRNILKNDTADLPPIDWSEIDVLLYHEKKSVLTGIKINKRTLLIFSAIAVPIIIVLGAIKIVQYYSSISPKEREIQTDPISNTFNIVENDKNILDSISKGKQDFINEKRKSDSIAGTVLIDTPSAPTIQKLEKKKKSTAPSQDPTKLDTAGTRTDTIESAIINPEPIPTPVEENNSAAPSTIDTINKGNPSQKKNSKRKNRKSQKTTDSLPAEAKPDSLKQ